MSNVNPPPPSSSPPPVPGPWGQEPPRPRLARRSTDKVLGGVCGGLADHLGVDATVVRVAAVLLAMTGWGVIIYLVAWAALPTADPNVPPVARAQRGRGRIPWLPIVIVAFLLFSLPSGFSVIAGRGHFGNATVPIVLLAGAAYLMWRATHGNLPRPGRPRPPAARQPGWTDPGHAGWQAPPPPDPGPGATTSGAAVPTASAVSPTSPSAPASPADRPLWARGDDDTDSASPAVPSGPAGDAGRPASEDADDPLLAEARRLSDPFLTEPLLFETAPAEAEAASPAASSGGRRRGRARSALAALLIGAGTVGLAVALGVTFTPFALLAGVLVAFGVALIFGGLSGRSSRGLIIPGLVVLGLLLLTAMLDLPNASAGERLYTPDRISEIDDTYQLGLGEMVIDLTEVPFSARHDIDIEADMGVGEMTVYVPDNVDVTVHASAGLGRTARVRPAPARGFRLRLDVVGDGEGAGAADARPANRSRGDPR